MHRVGIFSGTFDPIHEGHLQLACDGTRQARLDKVFFLVEPKPRRKQGVKAFEHRLNMVQLAIVDEPLFGSIVLDQSRFTPSETLPLLQTRFAGAELHLLMGDDMLSHLGDWPGLDELIKNSFFVIGVRGDIAKTREHIKAIEQTRALRFRHRIFQSKLTDISSSRIRSALRRGQPPVGLPDATTDYISVNRLYVADTDY